MSAVSRRQHGDAGRHPADALSPRVDLRDHSDERVGRRSDRLRLMGLLRERYVPPELTPKRAFRPTVSWLSCGRPQVHDAPRRKGGPCCVFVAPKCSVSWAAQPSHRLGGEMRPKRPVVPDWGASVVREQGSAMHTSRRWASRENMYPAKGPVQRTVRGFSGPLPMPPVPPLGTVDWPVHASVRIVLNSRPHPESPRCSRGPAVRNRKGTDRATAIDGNEPGASDFLGRLRLSRVPRRSPTSLFDQRDQSDRDRGGVVALASVSFAWRGPATRWMRDRRQT
jgi:hypothetical protein